jgi:Domain of unknown function (DUF4262)
MCDCCDYIAEHGGEPGDRLLARQWERAQSARIMAAVRRGGWRLTFVEADDERPPFAYTIGLWSHGHPELVVFGLNPVASEPLLNAVAEQVVAGLRLSDGDVVQIAGWPLSVFELPNAEQVALWAADFYGGVVSAVQLVYPDRSNVWPWEPACALHPAAQPMPGQFRA